MRRIPLQIVEIAVLVLALVAGLTSADTGVCHRATEKAADGFVWLLADGEVLPAMHRGREGGPASWQQPWRC